VLSPLLGATGFYDPTKAINFDPKPSRAAGAQIVLNALPVGHGLGQMQLAVEPVEQSGQERIFRRSLGFS